MAIVSSLTNRPLPAKLVVFGEVGLAYGRTRTSVSSTFTTSVTIFTNGGVSQSTRTQVIQSGSHSNSLATRSGAGVIVFF
jgi:predicted ATP-dependent serine protease